MALLFMDGFDHYDTAGIPKKWTAGASTSSPVISSAAGRRGSPGLRITQTGSYVRRGFAAVNAIVVGVAIKPSVNGGNTAIFLGLYDIAGGVEHLHINLNAANKLELRRGNWNSPTVLGTSATALQVGAYYYVELKATISDTVGSATVRINGAAEIALTGIDTRNGGNATVDALILGDGTFGISAMDFDDCYICDTSGASNNDFLGDVRVDTLLPNADGTYSQFAPSTGTSHYALVDEATPNTTDYNDGLTVGDRDSYNFANLAPLVSQTVFGVQANAAIQKDDAGSKGAALFARSSTTNSDGASVALSTSQQNVTQIYETNPNGGVAWTEATVNAAEFGVKVTA